MDMESVDPSITSSASFGSKNLFGHNDVQSLIKIQDIPQLQNAGLPLPPHIQYLITLKGDQDFISVHEWSARLCHALMVETGYFPVFDGPPDITAVNALGMSDSDRIPEFVSKLNPNCMYSENGIYALKYKVILSELVNANTGSLKSEDGDGPVGEIPDFKTGVEDGTKDTSTSIEPHSNKSNNQADGPNSDVESRNKDSEKYDQEWQYYFSSDINVTMLITEDRLSLTATFFGENHRPITHQFTINIEEFFVQKSRMVPVRLRPAQWIRKFDLNYSRFAGYFKSKFAIYLMDQLDGVVFERQGLLSLPYLVLIKLLKKLNIKTILNLGRSCIYIHNIVRDNHLWKFLLKRDFGNGPEPFELNYHSVLPLSPGANSASSLSQPETDFYEIFKQRYMSKHKRVHRMNSYPIRFHPTLRIGRRMPSVPFHFNRM